MYNTWNYKPDSVTTQHHLAKKIEMSWHPLYPTSLVRTQKKIQSIEKILGSNTDTWLLNEISWPAQTPQDCDP